MLLEQEAVSLTASHLAASAGFPWMREQLQIAGSRCPRVGSTFIEEN